MLKSDMIYGRRRRTLPVTGDVTLGWTDRQVVLYLLKHLVDQVMHLLTVLTVNAVMLCLHYFIGKLQRILWKAVEVIHIVATIKHDLKSAYFTFSPVTM